MNEANGKEGSGMNKVKFKAGDKVKCIGDHHTLEMGEIYPVYLDKELDTTNFLINPKKKTTGHGYFVNGMSKLFELVTTLEVGDRVKIIGNRGAFDKNYVNNGTTGVLTEVHGNGFRIRIDNPVNYNSTQYSRYSEDFELITDPITESNSLDELITTANKGFDALRELHRIHTGSFTLYNYKGEVSLNTDSKLNSRVEKIVKPSFKEFKLPESNYEVSMTEDGKRIQIGCKSFTASTLRSLLQDLSTERKTSVTDVFDEAVASRNGIKCGIYNISWKDCDLLIVNLTKAGL